MYSEKLWTTMDFVHLIDDMRAVLGDIESEYGLRLFPQGTVFEYWEQYRNLWNFLIQNLLIALSCTFVIGTIAIFIAMANSGGNGTKLSYLLKSMQGSFVMTIAIASTMTWVLGFMGYMEISMSAIPALTVIACMGICIDLTALVTLFFCAGRGTHDERIANALKCVFIPTLDSMMSTIVGCFALAFSVIELFVLYFFAMYVCVAMAGALNGLVLLPTLLYFIGPYASHESGGGAQKIKEPKHQLGTQVKKLKNADDQLTASAVDMHEL